MLPDIHELIRPVKREWRAIRDRKDYERVRQGYNDAPMHQHDEDSSYYTQFVDQLVGAGVSRSSKVLEAGCGTGMLCRELKRAGFGDVTAFDISDEHVAATTPHVKRAFRATCEDIPEPSNTYDLITNIFVIEHVMVVEKALSEFARLLKPGGQLYLTTDNAWWQTLIALKQLVYKGSHPYERTKQPIDGDFSSWEMKRLLENAGFTDLRYFGVGGIPMGDSIVRKLTGRPTTKLPVLRHFTTRFSFLARKA